MRNPIKFSLVLTLALCCLSALSQAQGFQTLEDKYGQSSSMPVQQLPTDTTAATNPATTPTTPTGDPGATTPPATTGSAAGTPSPDKVPPGMVYIGGKEWDIEDMIRQVSRWTGKFFMESGVKGKVTIIADGYMPVDLAIQTFYSALESNGYTTYETPGGVIRVIKQSEAKTKPKDLFRDKTPIDSDRESLLSEKIITRIISLDNISANDIYSVIKDMISTNGTSFAYPSTNSIVITDTGANIDHILKLVKELDTAGPQETLEIIPIQNADAKDIADKIKTIFESAGDDSGGTARRPAVSSAKKRTGSTNELQDVQAISQVIADERTNSVIVMGTKRMIMRIRSVIAKLDRALAGGEGSLHVYTLKYAKAEELEETLNKLVNGISSSAKDKKSSKSKTTAAKDKDTKDSSSSNAPSSAVELEGGIKVVADAPTNQLIITATPKDYDTLVEQVIAKLDVPRPSVYLEVVIMSMDVKKATNLGLSGLLGGIVGSVGGNNLAAFGGVLPLATTPSAIAAIAAGTGGLAAGVISDGTIDITDTSGNTTSIPSVSTILQALSSNTDVNVIATPSLLTLDKEDAVFEVGQNVPVITGGATTASDISTFSVDREKVGTKLTITPQVSGKETVRLDITQVISNVFSESDRLGPTLDEKTVDTTVVANDKQTIVIAGIMDDKSTVSVQKVPLLGDIPVLGNLFSNKVTEKSKSSLLVFITPYIIRESADNLAILKKKIEERNAFTDLNYGRKQRKQIRAAIQMHAADLLEFKCEPTNIANPCFSDASYSDKQSVDAVAIPVTDDTTSKTTDQKWDPRQKKKK